MPQHFVKGTPTLAFEGKHAPRLAYACKVDEGDWRLPRAMHAHAHGEIVLVCEGRGVHMVDNCIYDTRKGDLIFYNSGSIHEEMVRSEEKLYTYCVGIDSFRFGNLKTNCFLPDAVNPIVGTGAAFEPLRKLFELIYFYAASQTPEGAAASQYLLRALLLQLQELLREKKAPLAVEAYSLGRRIKDYIDANYLDDITLGGIAEGVRANAYYVSHIFKAMTGYAPIQYVTRRRIGEAQNLLIGTNHSVTRIAVMVGYNNSNYFQNVFKGLIGMPPGAYRRLWISEEKKKE